MRNTKPVTCNTHAEAAPSAWAVALLRVRGDLLPRLSNSDWSCVTEIAVVPAALATPNQMKMGSISPFTSRHEPNEEATMSCTCCKKHELAGRYGERHCTMLRLTGAASRRRASADDERQVLACLCPFGPLASVLTRAPAHHLQITGSRGRRTPMTTASVVWVLVGFMLATSSQCPLLVTLYRKCTRTLTSENACQVARGAAFCSPAAALLSGTPRAQAGGPGACFLGAPPLLALGGRWDAVRGSARAPGSRVVVVMLAKGGKTKKKPGTVAENRQARFNYQIDETFECGMSMYGLGMLVCRCKYVVPKSYIRIPYVFLVQASYLWARR